MIDMFKKVLRAVSFDRRLFKKELVKARNWLKNDEALVLKAWCLTTFVAYKETVLEVFDSMN